ARARRTTRTWWSTPTARRERGRRADGERREARGEGRRTGATMLNQAKYRVHLCFGPNCSQFNPKELLRALEEEVRAQGLEDDVSIQLSACRQRCEQSPSLNVYPGPVLDNRLTPDAIRAIVPQHLTGGE